MGRARYQERSAAATAERAQPMRDIKLEFACARSYSPGRPLKIAQQPARPVDVKEPTARSRGRRALCDELVWKVVIEVRAPHGARTVSGAKRCRHRRTSSADARHQA